jgi:outer membrane protein assembly factor BamB
VSASGTSNGIVWLLDTDTYCTNGAQKCAAAVLHAYDATNVASELWNSTLLSADAAGFAVKFTVPTVANGKVYVGTRGNNLGGVDTSTSAPGELDVYGLKPN